MEGGVSLSEGSPNGYSWGVPTVSAGVDEMGRTFVGSLLLYVLISAPAYPAPPAVVVAKKPSLVCPQTELGNPDLQARYATMWQRYTAEVDEATKKVRGEIEKQTKSATATGNLDLALFWKTTGKEFEQKGELRWDEPSLKKGWNDRFGGASFPAEFSVAVKKASEAFASARNNLEKGYGELVTEFTKAEKLEEALRVRGEIKELLAEKASAPESAPKPEPKKTDPATALGVKGKADYNAKTRELSIRYDFSSPDQIKDFKASPAPTVASVRQGQLVIEPNGILTHKVEYDAVAISGKLILPMPRSEKKPSIRLGVSANRKVFAYGGGSIRTDDEWIDVGGMKWGQPTQFRWVVGSPQMSLWVEGKQGSLPCNLSTVGEAIVEGSDQGCAFSELVISGRVTEAVADILSK